MRRKFVAMVQRVSPFPNELVISNGIRIAVDLDSAGRDEIERLRRHNLATMLTAARRAPAVRARLGRIDEVESAGDLSRLPVLTPAELAERCPPRHDDFLLSRDEPGLVLRSSGTAGKQKVVYHSWRNNERVRQLGARGVRATVPPHPPRRMANCMFAGELTGAFLFIQDLAQLLPALVFPIGSRTPVASTAEVIAEHGVDTLVAGPAYGTELNTGHAERIPSLRTFLSLGEAIGDERRQAIAAGAPPLAVRSLAYSTSETGPIGYQCAHQDGGTHHVHEDAVVVEILDERTGRPVPDGTAGEIVVTPLTDSGMALFRYHVGDRGVLRPEPCACGSAARQLALLGRTAKSITVDVTTISSDQLMDALGGFGVADPADCQFQVLWEFPVYRVRLLLSTRVPAGITAAAVGERLRETQFNRVLTNPRCVEFTVAQVAIDDFVRTERGKVSVLYQDLGQPH
jgi:phenylacetate-CoA ligase